MLVVRPNEDEATGAQLSQPNDFQFFFALEGSCIVTIAADSISLESGDSISIPPGSDFSLTGASEDLELLDVSLPN